MFAAVAHETDTKQGDCNSHTVIFIIVSNLFLPHSLKKYILRVLCCAENTILHQSSHINFGDCIFFCFFDLKNESRQKLMCFM